MLGYRKYCENINYILFKLYFMHNIWEVRETNYYQKNEMAHSDWLGLFAIFLYCTETNFIRTELLAMLKKMVHDLTTGYLNVKHLHPRGYINS
ncbi:hypothetical protein GDO81_005946 [Engystomops pustulosus]|uniref:Uncharacterized protein n=1 Tax=Engystomops pustulosus TaxID=76066 RepID=A0AAV7CT59_ENGPU|nr:hypothetical protein GDO81_005946 [Engystomops pustulosus]